MCKYRAVLKTYDEGDALFPILSTVKILRRAQKQGTASQPAALGSSDSAGISYSIVCAADQPLAQPPTQATKDSVPLIKALTETSAAILPAQLRTVRESCQYALAVQYPTEGTTSLTIPCQKVIAVIRSHDKSDPVP